MDLGTRLKNLRIKKGLSQRQLAKIVGCSHQSIAVYEQNGNLEKIRILQKICLLFGVSADYLINGVKSNDLYEITNEEIQLILKYRSLSEYYKSIVKNILEKCEEIE